MAQRVVTIRTDDLTGEEGDDVTNVTFSVAGTDYEIDLNDKNHDAFMKAIAPYMEHGRRIKRTRKTTTSTTGAAAPAKPAEDTAAIREWAKEQGYEISSRGRVPATIREAYAKAH